jgi:hypothetical protein
MKHQKSVFENLLHTLNIHKVKYLLVGGIAVNLYGIERMTGDIDIVIDMTRPNLQRLVQTAESLGLKPSMPVKLKDIADLDNITRWRQEKDMKVLRLHDPQNGILLLDLVFDDNIDFTAAYQSRSSFRAGSTTIPVISLDNLINMKKACGRPQDLADIYHLKRSHDDSG